jgi:ankyrin repeat protein
MYAASTAGDFVEAITTLIAAGADPNRAPRFTCPLLAAVGRADKVRALLAGGADPNAFRGVMHMHHGASVLHVAAYSGSAEVVAALLEGGADPDTTTTGGQRPVDVARGEAVAVLRALPSR